MSSPSLLRAASAVTDEDAYTALLEICTQLIINEDTDHSPVHRALGVLHGLLHCDHLGGDATVLSVRAVRILIDKYTPFLKSKFRVRLVECVRAALGRTKSVANDSSDSAFTFVHTKMWELQEELLQCMSAAQSDESVRAALPPPEEQLRFCVSVMDVSVDMCLQALRICSVLLRSGSVNYPGSPVAQRIAGVFREKLAALVSMEVNQDWLRLLRHLTEGTVTMRAYLTETTVDTLSPRKTIPLSKKTKGRKRKRGACSTKTSFQKNNVAAGAASNNASDTAPKSEEVMTWLRLCLKVCATPRLDRVFRSTVFSCASTVLSNEPALHTAVPTEVCVEAVVELAKELGRNVRTTLKITNPFLNREGLPGAPSAATAAEGTANGATASSASHNNSSDGPNPFLDQDGEGDDEDEDEDQGEDVLNNGEGVKWLTPEPEWPLLVLISVLLSAATMPSAEYMWWWVGDDEYARRFSRDDRVQLTHAFFAANDAVQLKRRGSRVHLSTMREIQWPFAKSCRVVFQPVPCAYYVPPTCTAPSLLSSVPTKRVHEQAGVFHRCDMKALFEHLSAVTRYEGTIAQFGRTVLLNLLLVVGPHSGDAARSALRSLLADASPALTEKVSEALLRYDRDWAMTLVEVGVTEATLHRSTSITPERSPVVRMLRREGASLPAPLPLLPKTPAALLVPDPVQLKRILQNGSREEVRHLLASLTEGGGAPWNTLACKEAVESLVAASCKKTGINGTSAPLTWVGQVEHVLAGVILKHLQDVVLQCQSSKNLKEVVEEAEIAQIELCGGGLSPAFCCPRRHPLHHHHSTNWVCNSCAAKGLDNAWSCRLCDYDLCAQCARTLCNRVEGAVTATALDVLAEVRGRHQHQQRQQPAEGALSDNSNTTLLEFFTPDGGFVSAATPLSCLHQHPVHVAELYKSCACGLVCPGPVKAGLPGSSSSAATAQPVDLLEVLLRGFGATCGQDVAVQRYLLKAYENVGLLVFIGGVRAVPPELRRVTRGLGMHLPLTVKHLVARFLAVDCRRYAFQVLHDQSAVVMSIVTGVTTESTKNHRLQMPREDKPAMVNLLYSSFRSLLSPVLRLDFTFEGEEGFGSGPSQELYTELSAYFRAEKKFWFVTEDDGGADPVTLPFPSATALFLKEFFVLGAACARSFVDDFRMNLDLVPEAWDLLRIPSLGVLLEDQVPGVMDDGVTAALEKLLEVLDPSLHRTFTQLRGVPETELAAMALEMDDGTPITNHTELNLHIGHTLLTRYEIALENLRQFQWGLLSVLELPAFEGMSNSELSSVLCGAVREGEGPLFTEDELRTQTTVGNGYSSDSPHVEMFISIVGGELTRTQQHDFLEFLTGSPRLPFNGLAGLGRLITVAMKDIEGERELTLPSCNTCFLYLKLPPYSTRDIMKARLLFAITEGRRNYSLS